MPKIVQQFTNKNTLESLQKNRISITPVVLIQYQLNYFKIRIDRTLLEATLFGYRYQQLMKSSHKFYRSHSDELKKFGTTLMQLRSSI